MMSVFVSMSVCICKKLGGLIWTMFVKYFVATDTDSVYNNFVDMDVNRVHT